MGKREFDRFLEDHETYRPELVGQVDPQEQLNEWLEYIETLYNKVENWLDDYIKKGRVALTYEELNITEELIGNYTVKQMNLSFAGNTIKLKPVGTMLIGTRGRVDIEGGVSKIRLLLIDKKTKELAQNKASSSYYVCEPEMEYDAEYKNDLWRWKIATAPPNVAYIELNEETFFDALLEIANG